jgi:hypothetical protein
MIAELVGHKQQQCPFDGCKGEELSTVSVLALRVRLYGL